MTTLTTSSSESSTIQTLDELSQETATTVSSSAASIKDYSILTSAPQETEPDEHGSSSELWETATNTRSFEQTSTNGSSLTKTDDKLSGRKGGAWRKAGGGSSSSEMEESYYSADWESSQSHNLSDSRQKSVLSTQQQFIQAKLRLLKKSRHKMGTTATQETVAVHSEVEEKSLFCQKAIGTLLNEKRQDVTSSKTQTERIGAKPESSSEASGIFIEREFIETLKIGNLLSAMKQAASVDTTSRAESCQQCQEARAAALKWDFIRQRTSRLKNELTERRLDWLLSTQDPLTVIGDLARQLPMPADDPKEVWNRLMDHGIT
ncbi:uncharacterized protein C8orf48-like [Acanthaster planci]|uniref:Uncharacterized protein C8orf48-like n=1 Tax=Acanthaster planci TaxID=133434 RepID=A0A8B7Y0Z0_ACAPL|nr:uncharacterized protein C8orf48-like [Acanthaster planci]XP_022086830.1 uncharacterized protein C8orf48-like [Acanthaster planci]